MIPQLEAVLKNSEYHSLPESIKQYYTETEWLWLPANKKATLIQDECEPDDY